MSRQVTEAHYLHARTGLEPVLQPPVHEPTVLSWIPGREELVAATREGDLVVVDPVLGTRTVARDLGETAALDIHSDRERFIAVSRTGEWRLGNLKSGEIEASGRHGFVGGMGVVMAERHAVLTGDEHGARVLCILSLESGEITGRARLPARVAAMLSSEGKPLLARSTPAGLKVIPLGKNHRFPEALESTAHRLKPTGPSVLGFTTTGICVWGQEGGVPRSMRLPDVTAGDVSADGKFLGLGTRHGSVALARIDSIDKRIHPDLVRAFDGPVTTVEFSGKGRWLATGAEGLRLWSWDE